VYVPVWVLEFLIKEQEIVEQLLKDKEQEMIVSI